MTRVGLLLIVIVANGFPLIAQQPAAKFDVASIKVSKTGLPGPGDRRDGAEGTLRFESRATVRIGGTVSDKPNDDPFRDPQIGGQRGDVYGPRDL
jgi:hypothetical protein